jgi:trehalose 6-phosphate synthase
MSRLICISNRTAADPSGRAGGLAVALWEALRDSGGLWVGWTGELSDTVPRSATWLKDEGVEFLLTDLSKDEYHGFYEEYSNRLVWPVFH